LARRGGIHQPHEPSTYFYHGAKRLEIQIAISLGDPTYLNTTMRTKHKKTANKKRTAVVASTPVVAQPKEPPIYLERPFRVPKMDTDMSCRRVLRNILRLLARDQITEKKARALREVVDSISLLTAKINGEARAIAIGNAFIKAVADGTLPRAVVPAEIFDGPALEGDYLPKDKHPFDSIN
jgi:hypothetical protein